MVKKSFFCQPGGISITLRGRICTTIEKLTVFHPSTPAKSLGTLPMIYAIIELQNSLPVKQCCGKEI